MRRLQDSDAVSADPLEYLSRPGLRAYIDFGLEPTNRCFVAFVASAASVDYQYEDSAGRQAFEFLRRTSTPASHRRRSARSTSSATAQSLWVAVHGLVALLISDKSFPFVGRQRLVDQLIATLMRGLKPMTARLFFALPYSTAF